MIPRVIHRVWLGSNPLPEPFKRYGETWSQHHPDWELKLWTDSNLPELRFPEALERARNHGERSDVLRYELLLRFGGLYLDTDVECVRNIEPLIGDAKLFAGWVMPDRVGSAVVGAVPEHPAMERLVTEINERVGAGGQLQSAGPKLLTQVLKESDDVTIFPSEVFYPFSARHPTPEDRSAFPEAYAIHHWEAAWKTREQFQEEVRALRLQLDEATARNERLEARVERLRRRRRRTARELRRAKQRLRALERSRWWRLGRRPRAALARARRSRS